MGRTEWGALLSSRHTRGVREVTHLGGLGGAHQLTGEHIGLGEVNGHGGGVCVLSGCDRDRAWTHSFRSYHHQVPY